MADEESLPLHDTLLAAAAQQLTAANSLMDGLTNSAKDLKESFQLSRRLKVTVAIGLVLLLLSLVSTGVLIVFAVQNHSLAARVNDCTTPAGECAKRGQQGTATAIAQIIARDIAGMIVVTECGRHTTTDHELEMCVKRHLPTS